jgi:hypothetical protein
MAHSAGSLIVFADIHRRYLKFFFLVLLVPLKNIIGWNWVKYIDNKDQAGSVT